MNAPRFGLRSATAESARRPAGGVIPGPSNPIVAWINAKGGRVGDYLDQLITVDMTLSESLAGTYCLAEGRRRLALTLFIDYAHEQGLSPGEVAMLLGDAQAVASDAINYIIGASLNEARADASRRVRPAPANDDWDGEDAA